MGTTTHNALPYPELSDASNVPQYIQQLADALDTLLGDPADRPAAGTASTAGAAADTNVFVDVLYGRTFSVTPIPVVTSRTAIAAAPVTVWISAATTTGFRINARRAGSALPATDWGYVAVKP